MLTIRVTPETKGTLSEAASARGMTVSAFVIDAAMKEASKPFKAAKSFKGVPTFFRAWCHTATSGGSAGYDVCGREFAKKIGSLIPDEHDFDSWADEIDTLLECCGRRDRTEVLSWLVRHYPRCMELVPQRRREQFIDGVLAAAAEGEVEA